MGFKCGIVGLPNVGKSTLFNALTNSNKAQAANFPFCTIDPNVGIVSVPDIRLKNLAEISKSKKVINKSHPNLLIVERSTSDQTKRTRQNIVLEDVKRLDSFLHMTANEDGWRVIIIDAVDDMNINAANYILKLFG